MLRHRAAGPSLTLGSPSGALFHVARHGPGSGSWLVRWLWRRRWRECPARDREDVIQDVATTLLESARAIVDRLRAREPDLVPGSRADGIVVGYVRKMVRHRVIDAHRRRFEPHPLPELVHKPYIEELVDLKVALEVLEEAIVRSGRERPALATTLGELADLARGHLRMEDLVRAGASPDETAKRARGRIYKRHQRARRALREAIAQMAARHETGAGVAGEAAMWADLLFLRRDSRPKATRA